jgi:acyl-homoserine lactone acylase PvdQ
MLDYFVRLLGLTELRRSVVKAPSQEERDLFQAYTDGVNAYLLFGASTFP